MKYFNIFLCKKEENFIQIDFLNRKVHKNLRFLKLIYDYKNDH